MNYLLVTTTNYQSFHSIFKIYIYFQFIVSIHALAIKLSNSKYTKPPFTI